MAFGRPRRPNDPSVMASVESALSNVARPGWMENAVQRSTDETNPAALTIDDNAPTLDPENTDFGFYYAAFRQAGDGSGAINVRIVPFIMPSTRIIPAPSLDFTV